MSGTNSPQSGLTRRSFLKAAGATGALGLAGAAGMTTADAWLAPTEAHAEAEERETFIYHNQHCTCQCALQCTVRDGRLVMVQPHRNEDKRWQNICLKGISEVQYVYSKERIQSPLRRAGERGEGKFEVITWDEAISEIAENIKKVQAEFGKDALLYYQGVEPTARYTQQLGTLLGAQLFGKKGRDRGHANGVDRAYSSLKAMNGKSPNTMWEWIDANLVICFAGNQLESGLVFSDGFFDAQDAGTKIVVVDPRFSLTASKADQWLPIKPGTDAALPLSMAKYIIDNDLCKLDYMRANTSFPFLVDSETGKIVKESDAEDAKPLVWDSLTEVAVAFDAAGINPAIEGTFTHNGSLVQPQFELLKKHLKTYTTAWAEETCGIEASVIEKLAREYAEGPSIINYGFGGCDKMGNGSIVGHAFVTLAGLTGNYGDLGTGVGLYSNGGQTHALPLGSWKLPSEFKAAPSPVQFFDMSRKENNVKAGIFFGDGPAQVLAGGNDTIKWIKTLDFIAMCDIWYTSTMDWADIILPVTTKFECSERVGGIKAANNYLMMIQKTLDPLFDSKSDFEIEKLLAAKLGLDQYLPESFEEYARTLLEPASAKIPGLTLEMLEENDGYMRIPGSDDIKVAKFRDHVYATPTTKQELYYEDMLKWGQAFPTYEGPDEINDDNLLAEKYPFAFGQMRSRFRIHSSYSAARWIQDIFEPCVEINPQDAEAIGLEDGVGVEVYNDRGSFGCKLQYNNSVRPGNLCMIESTYRRFLNGGLMQDVINHEYKERGWDEAYGPQLPFNDTRVAIRKA